MDMSDKLVAAGTDELELERERLKAESRALQGPALGGRSVSTVGRRLKLMFGLAAGASTVLGLLALGALVSGGAVTSGLLVAMVVMALAAAPLAAFSTRFVQNQLIHPIEELCGSMRELAENARTKSARWPAT